jgi:surfeit locus 1 family protein
VSPAPKTTTDPDRLRFRPTPWASLAALTGVALLVGLGTWQIQRLHWKETLTAARQARMSAPAIELPATIDPITLEYRRIMLTGRFLHDRELYLGSRPHGGVVGFGVVTPLVLSDGREVLVHRGWVPPERKDPGRRPEGRVEGIVALEAVVRIGGWKGSNWFRPDNVPRDNYWHWVDLPAMAAHAGLEPPVLEIYVDAVVDGPGGLPIAVPLQIHLPNDHLQYAFTWYALAFALLIIYLIYHTRRDTPP